MRKLLITILLALTLVGCLPVGSEPQKIDVGVSDYALIFSSGLDTVGRIYDDEKGVTCYIYRAGPGITAAGAGGMQCFTDEELGQ